MMLVDHGGSWWMHVSRFVDSYVGVYVYVCSQKNWSYLLSQQIGQQIGQFEGQTQVPILYTTLKKPSKSGSGLCELVS